MQFKYMIHVLVILRVVYDNFTKSTQQITFRLEVERQVKRLRFLKSMGKGPKAPVKIKIKVLKTYNTLNSKRYRQIIILYFHVA